MSSVRRRVSILSLSLSYFFHQFVNRESTRFTNGATVEDDARLAPGEKDRGGSSWEETGLEINSVSCILVWFPDGPVRLPAIGHRVRSPSASRDTRTTMLKQGRSRVIVSRFTTESIISICPSAYHRRLIPPPFCISQNTPELRVSLAFPLHLFVANLSRISMVNICRIFLSYDFSPNIFAI